MVKSQICDNVALYAQKYDEEFQASLVIVMKSSTRGSVVRVRDLNAEDPGSNLQLGLLNDFVLGDPWGKFTML